MVAAVTDEDNLPKNYHGRYIAHKNWLTEINDICSNQPRQTTKQIYANFVQSTKTLEKVRSIQRLIKYVGISMCEVSVVQKLNVCTWKWRCLSEVKL